MQLVIGNSHKSTVICLLIILGVSLFHWLGGDFIEVQTIKYATYVCDHGYDGFYECTYERTDNYGYHFTAVHEQTGEVIKTIVKKIPLWSLVTSLVPKFFGKGN